MFMLTSCTFEKSFNESDKGRVQKKKNQKNVDRGRTLGGGGLEKYWPVHNSIVIFGKLSLGGNLIVQLCIFPCKDKAMLGYNVFVMYLRAIGIFLLALKKYVKKYHIRLSTSQ